ncbi:MAG: hypothetical protein H6822_26715 [Planctomycetaceae bacterium]|nr:hypothetical protein [Planctomycetales bacterium]MCB9925772.1 hypothetical protein [Planctomycetaceae bacterium]
MGQVLRAADVRAIYLVHGSFVGADASGLFREIARVSSTAAEPLRRLQKQLLDALAKDTGNYTVEFANEFESAVEIPGEPHLPVRLFNWSSENHHIGRADGAVRLIEALFDDEAAKLGRVLIWSHSHGGNVLALMTNLLGGDSETREQFFHACRSYYRWPGFNRVDLADWTRVRDLLETEPSRARASLLDLVTFGTPVRYGWDSNGYGRLLHFIHHRPVPGIDPTASAFPRDAEEVFAARYGDYVQQFGIAGTNFAPGVWAWRAGLADVRLGRLLQPRIRKRKLFERLKSDTRTHDEGTNLLVDYGLPTGHIGQHIAGHAVYTRQDWLLFHAEEVARRFYGLNG